MVLAERAQALALTKFATMVRQDETRKEDNAAKTARLDDLQDSSEAKIKAVHKLRTADLLPPIIWGGN